MVAFGPLGAAHEKVETVGVYPVAQETVHVAPMATGIVYAEDAPQVEAVVAVLIGTEAK